MKKVIVSALAVLVLLTAVSVAAPIERVDITPAFLVNLSDGHSGSAMGGALTADLFFDRNFAVRTTIGYTKERYYPSALDYSDANYGFWMAMAPYAETSIGTAVRPFVTLVGTFSRRNPATTLPIEDRPQIVLDNPIKGGYPILQPEQNANSLSLGGTLGVKVRLMGAVSLLAEVTHHFYTTSDQSIFAEDFGSAYNGYGYEWNDSPTYMSLGLTYSFMP